MSLWKMKIVIKCRSAGSDNKSRLLHRLQLECGHVVSPRWNGKTHYIERETRARCYECGRGLND